MTTGIIRRKLRLASAVLFMVGAMGVTSQDIHGQGAAGIDTNLTYSRGQSIIPFYEGWHPRPDGQIEMWFGYLNQNFEERFDIPIGPDNNVEPRPFGPDAGQPTHFQPRRNYFTFAVLVPKDFDPKRELVWTITTHGQTLKAFGTLAPGYFKDDVGMQREYFGTPPPGNKAPVLTVEGPKQRTVKVGETIELAATATDDGLPLEGGSRQNGMQRGGIRLAWIPYRGRNVVKFDPAQFKVYEDRRGGSPWAATWVNPPIPAGNRWVTKATFREPGTYVLKCHVTDGNWIVTENVTFTVTQ